MALDTDVTSHAVTTDARTFFKQLNFDTLRARTRGSLILLTHVPLFRTDDQQCGPERQRETGHVTYEHPSFKYEIHHHVLSRELSTELLDTIQPNLVLSGHTHAWCAYHHVGTATMEYTTPAFSWGQRPDPSYTLIRLSRNGDDEPQVMACHLPQETFIFATYAATAAIILLVLIVRLVRALRTRNVKTKGA